MRILTLEAFDLVVPGKLELYMVSDGGDVNPGLMRVERNIGDYDCRGFEGPPWRVLPCVLFSR